MTKAEIQVFESVETLQLSAARQIAEALAPTTQGRELRIALSGGSTPRRMHELLATSGGINWSQVRVFWGDERTVPPDHEQSNYRMSRETLLDRVDIPERNVHRMRGEDDPAAAAADYERVLAEVFGVEPPEFPAFDVMILGVGDDGHTASLFPGTAALTERKRWVVANDVPQQRTTRLTLTYPVLNAARLVIVLAAGAAKRDALARVFDADATNPPPAAFIRPAGRVIWMLDEAANPSTGA